MSEVEDDNGNDFENDEKKPSLFFLVVIQLFALLLHLHTFSLNVLIVHLPQILFQLLTLIFAPIVVAASTADVSFGQNLSP